MNSEDQVNREMFQMLETVMSKGGMLDMSELNSLWRLLSDLGSELTVDPRPRPVLTVVE
ncbi:hypothetical protein RKLH11_607 [Rhodobacteraceae bacterium KLH11]|nr:hypothetical protein RKLH11_607 [Rhodobacteraceae bacterium KLH11]